MRVYIGGGVYIYSTGRWYIVEVVVGWSWEKGRGREGGERERGSDGDKAGFI
jgi:hypothetical protein